MLCIHFEKADRRRFHQTCQRAEQVPEGQWKNSPRYSRILSPILWPSSAPWKQMSEQANKWKFDAVGFRMSKGQKVTCFRLRVTIATLDLDNFGREISPSSRLDQHFS
jgi:hypothetical protein